MRNSPLDHNRRPSAVVDDAGEFRTTFQAAVAEVWGDSDYSRELIAVAVQWFGVRSRLVRQLSRLDHEVKSRGSSLPVRDRMAAELATAEAALRRCVAAARGEIPCPAPPGNCRGANT